MSSELELADKGPVLDYNQYEPQTEARNHADSQLFDPDTGVKRGLKTRHVSMIALAGIIGAGILVGVGGALHDGGPASLIIGFGIIGIIAFCVVQSVGELSTLYPTGGAFMELADRFVDQGFSAGLGWNYFIVWITVMANEYNTTSSVLSFWSDKVPIYGYFLLQWVFFLGFQLLGVSAYGEAEFWLALFKIGGLAAFFLFSLIYISGGIIGQEHAIGFQYWHSPGAWADGFRGLASVFVYISTFYAGVESIAISATETRNPAKAIPMATRQVFLRILFVYMGTAFFVGVTVPYTSGDLVNGTSKALKSPLTIAITNAGWAGGVHLVNAFILVVVISAINSSLYIGSRTVVFLAQQKKAPQFLGYINKRGVPVYAIIFTNLFGFLSIMNINTGASKAYNYIVNLSGVSTFIVWGAISFIHIRFRRAWAKQGRSTDELPYKALWYPVSAYFSLGANIFLALIQGWRSFAPFDAGNFVDAYILLPLFFLIWISYKLAFGDKLQRSWEIDLDRGRRLDVDAHDDYSAAEVPITDDTNDTNTTTSNGYKPSSSKSKWHQKALNVVTKF